MEKQQQSTKPLKPTNKWAERLRGRNRMAVAAIGGVFLAGFLGVSRPLGARIDAANERLTKAEMRASLAADVYELQKQAAQFEKRLPHGVDVNDWTQYFLEGIRLQRVKITRMDPRDIVSMGPCKAVSFQIEMEGDFESLAKVVAGIENGERLTRIDRLYLMSPSGTLIMSLTVRGLALDVPNPNDKDKAMKTPGGPAAVPVKDAKAEGRG